LEETFSKSRVSIPFVTTKEKGINDINSAGKFPVHLLKDREIWKPNVCCKQLTENNPARRDDKSAQLRKLPELTRLSR
jgi:hypothetical protein